MRPGAPVDSFLCRVPAFLFHDPVPWFVFPFGRLLVCLPATVGRGEREAWLLAQVCEEQLQLDGKMDVFVLGFLVTEGFLVFLVLRFYSCFLVAALFSQTVGVASGCSHCGSRSLSFLPALRRLPFQVPHGVGALGRGVVVVVASSDQQSHMSRLRYTCEALLRHATHAPRVVPMCGHLLPNRCGTTIPSQVTTSG